MLTPIVDKLCPRTAVRRIRNYPDTVEVFFYIEARRGSIHHQLINGCLHQPLARVHSNNSGKLAMAEVSQNCSNVHVLDRKRASHTFIENCAVSKLVQQLR